jgi:hypothetical protein
MVADCKEPATLQFHAAEDYKRPAGTPVFAMADGIIRFSGTAGGYGWLIVIDHPQANLYSLYGHLSPSRWKLKAGAEVKRGDLIGYLGDSDENGGSIDAPLEPHLHFGLRAGQVADYPTRGEWRFQAGWIKLCPQDVGWLQPSLVITSQAVPAEGFPQPEIGFLTRWGMDILITSAYALGGVGMLIVALRWKARVLLLLPGIVAIVAGIVLRHNRTVSSYTLLWMGLLIFAVGLYLFLRRPISESPEQDRRA